MGKKQEEDNFPKPFLVIIPQFQHSVNPWPQAHPVKLFPSQNGFDLDFHPPSGYYPHRF